MDDNQSPLTIELWRQRFQQQARWTRSLRQYLLPRAGLQPGCRLLEVGCGPGAILDEIIGQTLPKNVYANNIEAGRTATSQGVAELSLHGLDIQLDYLQYYKKQVNQAQLLQADAHQLPYPGGAFDLVVCHFLLLWVKDALQVVREMKRVCRHGGSLLALAEPDYGGRVDYPKVLGEPGRLQAIALESKGADPELGRRLGWLFSEAGLGDIELGVLGGQWSGLPGEHDWQMEWQVLADDLKDLASDAQLRAWQEIDRQAWSSGSRVLYVPTFYAWGKC